MVCQTLDEAGRLIRKLVAPLANTAHCVLGPCGPFGTITARAGHRILWPNLRLASWDPRPALHHQLSQRLSVNVSRSAQDLQRTYAQRSLPEPDVATQVSPSSTVDPATILWVLGRVYGILSGLTDGILWPTWGSSAR